MNRELQVTWLTPSGAGQLVQYRFDDFGASFARAPARDYDMAQLRPPAFVASTRLIARPDRGLAAPETRRTLNPPPSSCSIAPRLF
jgi:hypothetical protein